MPPRIRPTVPHSGARPHREHRADKSRREGHRRLRASARMKAERMEDIVEEDIEDQIKEVNEGADL